MKRNFNFIAIIFALVSVVFASCDMELFANKYLPGTLQGEVTVTVPAGGAKIGTELTAGYDGYEPVEYQWYRNGVPIPGATGKTFTPTEPGSYTVGVKAPTRGEKISHPPIVIKGLEGTIEITPDPPVVDEEVTAEYIPESGEPGPFKYEWLKEEPTGSGNWVNVSDSDKYTPTEPGTYMIVVTDESSGAQTSRTITVPPHPPLSGNVIVTGSGKTSQPLTAAYTGGSESPITYQWFVESPLNSGNYIPVSPPATGATFTPSTDGRYIAKASAPGYDPKNSAPVRVTATGGLTGTISLTNEPLTAGNTSTATYNPVAPESMSAGDYSYEWFAPSTPLTGAPTATGATSPTLTEGTWTVRVTGPNGRIFERQIDVGGLAHARGNLYLNPNLTTPVLSNVTPSEAIDHVNANTNGGLNEYTLKMHGSGSVYNVQTINTNAKITIMSNVSGAGGERILTYNQPTGTMFRLQGTGLAAQTLLTLGENITLTGSSNAQLVYVLNGTFTMLDGSKISGFSNTGTYAAVEVTNATGRFIMEGGSITGNSTAGTSANAAGGVHVRSSGGFTMSGGTIIGNTRGGSIPSDIFMEYTLAAIARFTISDDAVIDHLILHARSVSQYNNIWSGDLFSGRIEHVYLYFDNATMSNVISTWLGRTVIQSVLAANIIAIRDRITTVSFLNNTGAATDISPTYHICAGLITTANAGVLRTGTAAACGDCP